MLFKRGHSTKIHAICIDENTAISIVITAGQEGDSPIGAAILKETVLPNPKIKSVLADKGYDSNAIRSDLENAGKEAVIPPRANRVDLILYDKQKYKNRNKTERFFGKIKEFRGIATRYDKLARRFLAGVNSVLIALLVRNYPNLIVNRA